MKDQTQTINILINLEFKNCSINFYGTDLLLLRNSNKIEKNILDSTLKIDFTFTRETLKIFGFDDASINSIITYGILCKINHLEPFWNSKLISKRMAKNKKSKFL